MKQRTRFKRSGLLAKVIIVIALVYAAITLLHLHAQIADAQGTLAVLSEQLDEQRQANAALESSLKEDAGAGNAESAARDRLGLVLPNEKVFYDVSG